VTDGTRLSPAAGARLLTWDGCLNVRDLGGFPVTGGGTTRVGAIVRADSVRRLSAVGWEALTAYGIETVVDLRLESELAADPPHAVPVTVVHAPLFAEQSDAEWEAIDALGLLHADAAAGNRAVYGELLARNHAGVAGALRAIAAAPEGGVLVHCHAGKDRTGLVSALLLELAGVDRSLIGADYAQTGVSLASTLAEWVDEAADPDEREQRRRIAATPPEAIVGVLDDLDDRHGSPREFLLAAGITEPELERLVARLVD
jgi:hypothetical protein